MGIKYNILILEIKEEFPRFKMVPKSQSRLCKIINTFLSIITFGRQRSFMTKFTTTIGSTIYTPIDWDNQHEANKLITLRHECIHLRQAQKYGRVLFSFLYLFIFFPVIFAYYRKKFECEGYFESIRASVEYYGAEFVKRPEYKDTLVKQFTTVQYFWSWPFKKSIERWFDQALEKILREYEENYL